MPLNPVASWTLVLFYIFSGVVLLGLLAAVAVLLNKVYQLLVVIEAKVDPLLTKTGTLLTTATEKVEEIGGRTEAILDEGVATTEVVHDRVERTATAVQQTVAKPLVGVNALAAGVARGAATFLALQKRDGSAINNGNQANDPHVVLRKREQQDASAAETIGMPLRVSTETQAEAEVEDQFYVGSR